MEEEEGIKIKRIKNSYDDCRMVDRISELPEFVIHYILSFLDSPRELTKTSILSKRWYHHIWGSLPELDFLEDRFCQVSTSSMTKQGRGHWVGEMEVSKDLQASRLKFINFMDKTLLRYQINRFPINKLCLHTSLDLDDSHVASLVEKWMNFVLAHDQIKELHLQLGTWYTNAVISLSLPQKSFFSGSKSLKVLRLHGFSVGSSCCRDHQIAFCSLKILHLELIRFYDDQVLDNIISNCPLLEEIILTDCRGLKKLQLYNPVKLKSLEVTLERKIRPELEVIDCKALSLESFSFNNGVHSTIATIEMAASKNLKALCLGGITTKNWPFLDFITQFPLLEVLVLDSCMKIETITISSSSLKCFRLITCGNLTKVEIKAPSLTCFRLIRCGSLTKVEIEAPSLKSFQYEGDILPRFSSINTFGQREAILDCTVLDAFDISLVRNFISSNHFSVVTLRLDFDEYQPVPFQFQLNNLLFSSFDLEHLKLEVRHLSSDYPAVLDGLLLGCCPRMVTLKVTYELANCPYRSDFIKYIFEKLRDTAHTWFDDGYMSDIPKSSANKVEIEIFERGSSKGRATDPNVLFDILPTIEGQIIQFGITSGS